LSFIGFIFQKIIGYSVYLYSLTLNLLPSTFIPVVIHQLISVMRRRAFFAMRGALCAMLFTMFFLPSFASAVSVTLGWDLNQEADIGGYRLYYGSTSGNYTQVVDVGKNNQYKVNGLQGGTTYYFAATAYDASGNESAYSRELVHTPPVVAYTISTSAGANGRITPSGTVTVTEGTNKTFSIHPDADYQVLNVEVDGVSVGTVTTYSFKNITGDHTISASFAYGAPPPVADSDGDGVPDDQDDFPLDPNETTDTDGDTIGNNADTDDDNDGMPDSWENMHNLNPLIDDASQDPDEDGVSNLNEYLGGTEPHVFEQFLPPEPPGLLSPADEEIVSLAPVLQADAFYDPDANDVHTASQWQIIRAEDQVIVYDRVSQSSLTTLILPKLILAGNTTYAWQVKFIDNHGLSSEWSESGTFTTGDDAEDADGNGIPDDQEVASTLDLDADGTPDSDQGDIKCIEIQGESTQIGISIRESDTVLSIEAVETQSPADHLPPARTAAQQANLPFGLISFKLIVDAPGDEAVVTLHLSRAAAQDSIWYKYDPVEDAWYDNSAYTEFSADRKKVYLTLVDGGFGDADGIANGIIVDPLALIESSSTAAAADAVSSGGGGSGAACFISLSSADLNTTGSASIRQTIVEIAFILTALLLIVFLNLCLKKWVSHRVR